MNDITKQYFLDAPLPLVYEKWLSNETIVPPAVEMAVTPKVGGNYTLVCLLGESKWTMFGEFLEVVPCEKLKYTWEWNGDGEISVVTVNFSQEQNQTKIDILHTDLPNEDSQARHSAGWDSYIEGFKKHL